MSRGHKRTFLGSVLRVCVPLLLIGLLLYNPFSVLITHTDGLAYKELARHRATVGASEMQHFSPIQADGEPALVLFESAFAEPVTANEFQLPLCEEVLPVRPEPFENIWFRPPPSA